MEKRDMIVDFVNHWKVKAEMPRQQLLDWLELSRGRFRQWEKRHAKPNLHNASIPKSNMILPEEKQAIINYAQQGNIKAGYRRMTYLMLDENIAAVSASSVYRVLKEANLIQPWGKPSKKGTGFKQPSKPHEHWHTDITYLKLNGAFHYLACVLDGASRAILSWDLKESIKETEMQIILQKARETYPGQTPRIITDNGPQFISSGFKQFVEAVEMTHVRTSPYYPQSNGKIERFHKSIKHEVIRPKSPVDQEDAKRIIGKYIYDYNNTRLHSAIGYVPPILVLEGRADQLQATRKEKLKRAQQARKNLIKPFSSQEENDITQSAA